VIDVKLPSLVGGCPSRLCYLIVLRDASSLSGRVIPCSDVCVQGPRGFLPAQEGVPDAITIRIDQFRNPPCVGGCPHDPRRGLPRLRVSSLCGRVIPTNTHSRPDTLCLLPWREGDPMFTGACVATWPASFPRGRVIQIYRFHRHQHRGFLLKRW